ncbi:hypothetical protein DSM112329_03027 [Paraconexibacter sp. AEG42_29]|uniref:Tetratricopeptide repeat protein n=1 Tax=Paraconexibacter sp. AEG42_29 TaxID=2997339 RepID=A0AAU7AXX9_9ACTN
MLAAVQAGNLGDADRALRSAIAKAPRNWALRRDRAVLLQRLGDVRGAEREMQSALQMNPLLVLPPGFGRVG